MPLLPAFDLMEYPEATLPDDPVKEELPEFPERATTSDLLIGI